MNKQTCGLFQPFPGLYQGLSSQPSHFHLVARLLITRDAFALRTDWPCRSRGHLADIDLRGNKPLFSYDITYHYPHRAFAMPHNRGRTTLKRRKRVGNTMAEFDRLPTDLRQWLTQAALPWHAKSALKSYSRALSRKGCRKQALAELDRIQSRLVAKDAARIWGKNHPDAQTP